MITVAAVIVFSNIMSFVGCFKDVWCCIRSGFNISAKRVHNCFSANYIWSSYISILSPGERPTFACLYRAFLSLLQLFVLTVSTVFAFRGNNTSAKRDLFYLYLLSTFAF